MLRVMPITGALAAMLAAAPGARAQVTSSQDTARSPWPTVGRDPTFGGSALADSAFIRQAIRGNYTEVALGRLAESRAADSDVKDFAERMVSDHNSMNQAVGRPRAEQRHEGRPWTSVPRGSSRSIGSRASPAPPFDQAYMSEMIREHEQDLAAFERMATSARSPEVRQLASSGASTVREHLALAQQVGSRSASRRRRAGWRGRARHRPPPTTPGGDRDRRREPVKSNNANNNEPPPWARRTARSSITS